MEDKTKTTIQDKPHLSSILRFLHALRRDPIQTHFDVVHETPYKVISCDKPASSYGDKEPTLLVAYRKRSVPIWWIVYKCPHEKYRPRSRRGVNEWSFEGYAIIDPNLGDLKLLATLHDSRYDDTSSSAFLKRFYDTMEEINDTVWARSRSSDAPDACTIQLEVIEKEMENYEPAFTDVLRQKLRKSSIPALKQLSMLQVLETTDLIEDETVQQHLTMVLQDEESMDTFLGVLAEVIIQIQSE